MLVSLVTPTHNPQHLQRLARSLESQTCKHFEWLVSPNNAALSQVTAEMLPSFARVAPYKLPTQNVGAMKLFANQQAKGDVLVELDHDDELPPNSVEEIAAAFADGNTDFAYSNFAQLKEDEPHNFPEQGGWRLRPFAWRGKECAEHVSFPPTPASFSRIWYGPNHFRAWKAEFYHDIGGHNPQLDVLDDQELFMRSFLHGNVQWIDKCLYVYHLHKDNTFAGPRNKRIQTETLQLHDQYIERLCERWSKQNNLTCLDLCGGISPRAGFTTIDKKNADITADLDERWPIPDGSVGVIRAHDALEHLKNPIHTMKEVYRVLADDGFLLSHTPSTDGRGAFQDPTHVSFWNENSFWYYTRQQQNQYIDCPVRFQSVRCFSHFPSEWHKQNSIPYVRADLLKIGNQRVPGRVTI
jgi:hypothetical protein